MMSKYPFEYDGCYHYGFTSSGFFTLIDKKGDHLYQKVIPLFHKLGSHFIWILFYLGLIVGVKFLLSSFCTALYPLLMSLIFFHLFILGCRLTTLLIEGGIWVTLFPPLWMRITRELSKGGGLALLKKYEVENHPGLLINLALIQISQEQLEEAKQTIRKAHALCPGHPYIKVVYNTTACL